MPKKNKSKKPSKKESPAKTEPLPQSAGGPGDTADNPSKTSIASMPVFNR